MQHEMQSLLLHWLDSNARSGAIKLVEESQQGSYASED
jgi:hypothetical protein